MKKTLIAAIIASVSTTTLAIDSFTPLTAPANSGNTNENPSDIWVATDADGDGLADIIDLFASLGVAGSEATGFIVDPRGGYLVNIQHSSSGNDALWSITQASVVPVPAAAWLFGSGMLGLIATARRKKTVQDDLNG